MRGCVIFDMDGVLVASGRAHEASWQAVARKSGIQVSDETFRTTFGRTSRDIVRILWGKDLSDDDVARIDDEKEAAYRDLVRGLVPLTIGVRETLHNLAAAGFSLAVGTSGPRANADLVLDETRLRPLFAALVTREDVTHGKPAPDIFALAGRRAGAAPERCVVVEDAPVGIQAAHAAGMKCIAFEGTHSADHLRGYEPEHVATRMADITPDLVFALLDA